MTHEALTHRGFSAFTGRLTLLLGLGAIVLGCGYPLRQVHSSANFEVDPQPELVARGEYLAVHVSGCMDCHSVRDWSYYSAPIRPGSQGQGGLDIARLMGLASSIPASNITPTALAAWSDAEIARAIVSGVDRAGRYLTPLMPYPNYSVLTGSDLQAIVAYLRSLAPLPEFTSDRQVRTRVRLLSMTLPRDPSPTDEAQLADPVARGRYLATVAGCIDCHTPHVRGHADRHRLLTGGVEFRLPSGDLVLSKDIRSAALRVAGISEAAFIGRFKAFAAAPALAIPVPEGQPNTPMAWTLYAGMTEEDLGAIFKFLMSN